MAKFSRVILEAKVVTSKLPDGTIKIDGGEYVEYRKHGNLHRTDGPAIIDKKEGTEEWFLNGKKHRVDGPAWIAKDPKHEAWWLNNVRHRVDGPAIIRGSYESWWLNGRLHRTDGPAIIDRRIGREEWYLNGNLHRTDGPAVANREIGSKEWWLNGRLHRTDGPARMDTVTGVEEYWVNGKPFSEEEYDKHFNIKESIPGIKMTKLPDGGKRYENDSMVWYDDKDSKFHRVGGPALYSKNNKFEQWYIHGKLHRVGGPACVSTYINTWYQHNMLHRTDGPAVEDTLTKREEYWINGNRMSKKEFERHFGDD